MKGSELGTIRIRIVIYRALLVLVFVVLIGQLWRLQMVQGDYYREAADLNRFRLQSSPGPRGVIYDRWGHLLVRNTPQITVALIPAYLPENGAERHNLLKRLSELLDVPLGRYGVPDPSGGRLPADEQMPLPAMATEEKAILDILREAALAPYRPVTIKVDVPRETALMLEEEHLDWPGVLVEIKPEREYVYGSLVSHFLGYVGVIPKEEAERYKAEGYDPNQDKVGLAGVEYTFERELRGRDGQKLIEVDVAGREVRTVGKSRPAVSGHSLRLTLDLDLQRAVTDLLTTHLKEKGHTQGVVVAMNPQTGEILAMVSLPSYDNNDFAGGISLEKLEALQKNPDRPLLNQAISGQFPPGSTFKIITASGGLEERVIGRSTPLRCGGILWLPNRFYPEDPSLAQPFYCWIRKYGGGHGSLSVVSALGQSCDIFFYQVGGGYRSSFRGLGEERLGYYAELFGLGRPTGIDLPGEAAGLVPTRKWKRVNYSESWVTGDTYNMAIGQGFVLTTPLQMLNAAAAIANGGTLYRPQIVRDVIDSEGRLVRAFAPDVIRQLPLAPEHIELVQQGMRAAVAGAGATARVANLPNIAVAGKTGTAEFFIDRNKDGQPDRDKEGHLPTHSWFVAYAPYENPKIALVAFVFGGGDGSATAAPIAVDVLKYYFSRDLQESTP